jgi:hypothetical protein
MPRDPTPPGDLGGPDGLGQAPGRGKRVLGYTPVVTGSMRKRREKRPTRLVKRRYCVQRLIRFSLAHALLPGNGELLPRRLTGNAYQ